VLEQAALAARGPDDEPLQLPLDPDGFAAWLMTAADASKMSWLDYGPVLEVRHHPCLGVLCKFEGTLPAVPHSILHSRHSLCR
jgi:hypothetical protein